MSFDVKDLMSKDKKVIRDVESPKKQGRPKKDVTRNNIVTTYLTDEENNKFRINVAQSELSVAAYLRSLIIEKIQK